MNQREQLIDKMLEAYYAGSEKRLNQERMESALSVFEEAHANDLATSPGRVKNQADSSNVPASADERTPTAELDARQAAYQQDRIDWFADHESEPEIATNAFFRGWDAHTDHAAHVTPTDHHVDHHDDEQEALANLIPLGFSERDGVRNVYDAADRILAVGFHRTVQSELCLTEHPLTGLRCSEPAGSRHGHVCDLPPAQGEPSNVSEQGVSDISPAQMSVQGEPSTLDGKCLSCLGECSDSYHCCENCEHALRGRGEWVEAQAEPSLRDHVRNLTGVSDAELDALGGFTGEPTSITLAARGVGKTQALIESMLAQANERGIRLEVVYPQGEPTDSAVSAAGEVLYGISWGTDLADPDLVRAALRAAAAVQGGERHGD